ncbi:zinc-binding dehydrogenase [Streptomyces sp. NPDC092296]|uniref:zinc-binding dehydrogenase n=1 Tax=Streptomyces sp. NPDC092296 TaxID=3366012 RepID=UPI00380BE8AA
MTVRLSAAALCGSDLPKFRSTADPRSGRIGFPIHECVGHVLDAGGDAGLEPGQRVLAMPDDECGLAEVYLANRDATHPVSAGHLTDAQATLIQPLAAVLYATAKLGDVAGARVTVLGLGPIGLMCAYVLSRRGARVTGVDPVGRSKDITTAFGIEHHLQDSAAAWSASAHATEPVDICIEAVGHQQRTVRDAVALTRHSGTILALGVPDDAEYAFPYEALLRGNITLKTSITPPWQQVYGPAEDYLCAHLETMSLLLTHTFPVTEAAAYRAYAQPADDRLKVIITTAGGWMPAEARS